MTLVIIVFGFFAVLIARELPGRRRVWPYVVAGLFAGLIGFARLYLGANWLSDLLGGMLFGLAWVALLGLAYRRRVERSFWIRPLVVVFFGTLVAAAWWYGPRRVEAVLNRFDPLPVVEVMSANDWLQADAVGPLSRWRNELRGRSVWPLNLQFAGDPANLASALAAQDWQVAEPGGWLDLLMTLDDEATPDTLRILPASHYGHPQVLMLVAESARDANARQVLRLWRTGVRLENDIPVWVGNAQTLHFSHRWHWLHYWRLDEDDGAALARVSADARRAGLELRARAASAADPAALVLLRERTPDPAPEQPTPDPAPAPAPDPADRQSQATDTDRAAGSVDDAVRSVPTWGPRTVAEPGPGDATSYRWGDDPRAPNIADRTPLRRNVTIEEVGNAAAFLCSDLASYMTGSVMLVDGGCSLYPMDD